MLLFSDALLNRKCSYMLIPASCPVTAAAPQLETEQQTRAHAAKGLECTLMILGKVCPNIVGEYTLVIISGLFSCDHMDEIKKFSEEEIP